MISFKIFIIYMLITGMLCHYGVTKKLTMTKEEIDKLPEKKREEYEEIKSLIYVNFGNMDILPFIQIMALLLGWLLIPYSILNFIIEKFDSKNL